MAASISRNFDRLLSVPDSPVRPSIVYHATTLDFPTCLPSPPRIFPITATIAHTCFSSIRLVHPRSLHARKCIQRSLGLDHPPISPRSHPEASLIIAIVHLRVGCCVQISDLIDDKLAPSFISPPLGFYTPKTGCHPTLYYLHQARGLRTQFIVLQSSTDWLPS